MATSSLKCLVLPGDTPPRRSSLKRQLLFFDALTLVHPEDQALINDYDLRESFPDGVEIHLTARAPFPRSDDYTETITEILSETADLQSQGKIHVLRRTEALSKVDAGTHWTAYLSAISKAQLVRAAIPDYQTGPPSIRLPNGVYTGASVAVTGYPSRYDLDVQPPAELPGIDDGWNGLAWIRTGRHLKYARLAAALGCSPLSLDEPNRQLSLALNQPASPSLDALADYAIAVDAADPLALDRALQSLTWKETMALRRNILPHVAKLRDLLLRKGRDVQAAAVTDPSAMAKALASLKSEYARAKDDVDRKWSEFGIAIVSKGLAALTAGQVGLSLLPASPIAAVILKLLGGAVATGAVVSGELKGLIPARTRLKAHPLAFFDTLPEHVASLSK